METNGRLAWVLVGSSTVVAGGLFLFGASRQNDAYGAAGALGLIVSLAIAGLLSRTKPDHPNSAVGELLSSLKHEIQNMSHQASLSDDARRVLNRASERDLLCQAIEEDIQREDWGAATVLCNELANRFGYRHEAESFRERVAKGRTESVERRVSKAIAFLDGLIIEQKWEDAFEEAARIARLYHESPRAQGLDTRVEAAREQFKVDLE